MRALEFLSLQVSGVSGRRVFFFPSPVKGEALCWTAIKGLACLWLWLWCTSWSGRLYLCIVRKLGKIESCAGSWGYGRLYLLKKA